MLTRSYDMNVTKEELTQAILWWRSLSINEMKAFESKYFSWWGQHVHERMIHQMWEEEGKP